MSTTTSYSHGQFCWVDLVAHDMPAAQRFYEQFFGWTAVVQDTQGGPPYAMFQKDGRDVAGVGQMSDELKSQGIPPLWNSYINVDSVEAVAQRAAELGGTVTVPPMPVLDAGWLAYIQDPTGGNVGLWQKGRHSGAQVVGEPGAFCWNELATRDIEAARNFFAELFGWEFADNPHSPSPYLIIKSAGCDMGGIVRMTEQWGNVPPHWAVYFTVENADAAVTKLGELGGNVHVPAFDIPVGRMAVVSDPQGAAFVVIQLAQQPA